MIERDRDDTTPCLGERAKRNNDSLSVMGTEIDRSVRFNKDA